MSQTTNATGTGTDTASTCTLHRGSRPLLLSLPHVGTRLPEALQARLLPRALALEDTDWHLERLYGFARAMDVSVLVPRYSRYVVDLNRPPENQPMYPGANNTGLCPATFFTGEPLYQPGQAPAAAEVAQRVATYWRPYHAALAGELARLQAAHGQVVLFDGHSIRSELPWLFDGRLPDLNLGTASGQSCAPALRNALAALLAAQTAYSVAVDGRFKGGHITRSYGRPADGVHAVQLEMVWRCYMDETPPCAWREDRAAAVQPLLRQLVQAMLDFAEGSAA
jgi:N-formylglutamate deformylase